MFRVAVLFGPTECWESKAAVEIQVPDYCKPTCSGQSLHVSKLSDLLLLVPRTQLRSRLSVAQLDSGSCASLVFSSRQFVAVVMSLFLDLVQGFRLYKTVLLVGCLEAKFVVSMRSLHLLYRCQVDFLG